MPEEALGIALGQMGMDINSFYQLTSGEFEIVFNKWSDLRDAEFRNKWEQTRLQCFYSFRPYMDKKKTIKRFMPFAWDGKTKDKRKRTKVRDPKRFERLKKEYGVTTI
jgi:hypothetical protein